MSDFVKGLDAEIERRSLLKHEFYKMWSQGKLTKKHLAGYSKEYFQLVRAVPDLVGLIGGFVGEAPTRKVVSGIRREESEHVELWARFAESMGVSRAELMSYNGTPKTSTAVSRLKKAARKSFCEGASAMYAIESEQPKISGTKLDGLVAFYGMTGKEAGSEYFREHKVADIRHAAVWRGLLQKEDDEAQAKSMAACELSLGAQNAILDSVMETYVAPR